MKILFGYFLAFNLLLVIVSCNEKEVLEVRPSLNLETSSLIKVKKSESKLIAATGLVHYNDIPLSGTTEDFYTNGQLKESIDYKSGKRQGFYRKWFDDGTLSFESNYRDGKQSGSAQSWWRNGNLRSEAIFLDGIAHGKQRQWYKSGKIFKEINLKRGKENGLQRSWRENGKLYNNYEAKNGRIFGLKRANLCFSLDNESVVYEN